MRNLKPCLGISAGGRARRFSASASALVESEISRIQQSPELETRRRQLTYLFQFPAKTRPESHLKQIHAQFVASGLVRDPFFGNNLVGLYSKHGFLCQARMLFDRMPERTLISWSAMASLYTKRGFSREALLVFLEFQKCCSERPSEHILGSVIRACTQLGGDTGEQLHGFSVKGGLDRNVYVGTALGDLYAKCGDIDGARLVFDGLEKMSVVSLTMMIKGYERSGKSEEALQLFKERRETVTHLDNYVLSSLLSACSRLRFLEGGKQIHCQVLRWGGDTDVSVANAFVDFYSKCGKVGNARKLFDRLANRDIISWTTMIAGYMQNSFDKEAMSLFVEMNRMGWKPDEFACTSILTSCGSLEAVDQGRQVHAYSIKANTESDLFVQNALIDMYAKCDYLTDARRVFDSMDDHNEVSYNAMIEGYSRDKQLSEALDLFRQMRFRMLSPGLLTFVSLLGISGAMSTLGLGTQIHANIIKFGISKEIFAGSALVDVYSKCSCILDARLVFERMGDKDIVIWNAMFSGYVQQQKNEEALNLFSELQLSEQEPNGFTFADLIKSASNLASLQLGQQFHSRVIKIGLDFDSFVTNSLTDMYAKCGSFEGACKMSELIICTDVVRWNSLMWTYAHHGEAEQVLCLFERMLLEGVKPNYVTFVVMLTACSHAGLVQDGLYHFKSMSRFGIVPGMEHYACVVSLLGRAGKLYEAKEFIETMPIQPTAAIWRILLGACRVSDDVELGIYTAEKAISIDPKDSSSYSLLSNIFASKGMWEDVKRLRTRMDLNGVVKEPGYSWIEVNNDIHLFIARDRTHYSIQLIDLVLDHLIQQIKGAEDSADASTVVVNG